MEEHSRPEHPHGPDANQRVAFEPTRSPYPQSDTCLDVGEETPFGAPLGQVLVDSLDGRLRDVSWFRTDWQRGGALTGYATYRDDQNTDRHVVIKMPVPPRERNWLVRLQPWGNIVPHVYAHGDEVGGFDMVWIIMERLKHGPLGQAWDGREFDLLIEAAGRFYEAAATVPIDGEPRSTDWESLCAKARKNIRNHAVPHQQRWNNALKKANKRLRTWVAAWDDRPIDGWCHGDLHFGNAMTRAAPPEGPALLFDFALARPGYWLEDAIYLEHLFWAHRDRLGSRRIARDIAHERKHRGLPIEPDWADLANVKRGLLAMSVPAMLEHEGDPMNLQAALDVLETQVGA